jgi:uncharacterized protein with HEPN domain
MSLSSLEYLRHILDETEYLTRQTRNLTRERFMRDETLQRAFVRSIEIIGEATKQIPDDFREKYRHLEWRAMAGMRDKLVHEWWVKQWSINCQ